MSALRMKLVFRLGDVGFSVSIDETVEILEALPGWLNRDGAEPLKFILGDMIHRGKTVPVRDLRRRMQLPGDVTAQDAAVLVLGSEDESFALTADSIDGIFPLSEFSGSVVPFQFVDDAPAYHSVDIWRAEPLVALDVATLTSGWVA